MQPVWHTRPVPPNDGKAIAALVLGIVCLVGSPCWLGGLLGVPAIVLGVMSFRDIRRGEGMLGGTGMATAGVVMGSIGSLVFAVMVGFAMISYFKLKAAVATIPTALPPIPASPTPAAPPPTPPLVPPGGWGRIHVVVLHPSAAKTLRAQLADEARAAKTAGETVLVETIAPSCAACAEISRAMPEPEMQVALANVRVVHVDVDEFGPEASSLHVTTPSLPWFYLVDTHGEPRDGISADEWDDNEAAEIAPVIEAFVGRKLAKRRKPWPGGTAL